MAKKMNGHKNRMAIEIAKKIKDWPYNPNYSRNYHDVNHDEIEMT